MTDTPQFAHDCDKCQFLGRYICERYGECDLYYCDQGAAVETVVARYGNDGPQYTSGMAFVGSVPCLTEAHRRWLPNERRQTKAGPRSPR